MLTFIKAAKFLVWPFDLNIAYSSYLKIIFAQLYDNFFIFETFITLFYFIGISSFVVKRKFSFAMFCMIFTLFLRLRIQTKLHMAPFYLFSYWLVASGIAIYLINIYSKTKILFSSIMIFFISVILILFVSKNWYDFKQLAFNKFPKSNEETINFLMNNSSPNDKILVLANNSASYYYDSQRIPYGFFINYFPWYDWSDKLRNIWLSNLKSYEGNYLILDYITWSNYSNRGEYDAWLKPTLDIMQSSYIIQQNLANNNLIFCKQRINGQKNKCLESN